MVFFLILTSVQGEPIGKLQIWVSECFTRSHLFPHDRPRKIGLPYLIVCLYWRVVCLYWRARWLMCLQVLIKLASFVLQIESPPNLYVKIPLALSLSLSLFGFCSIGNAIPLLQIPDSGVVQIPGLAQDIPKKGTGIGGGNANNQANNLFRLTTVLDIVNPNLSTTPSHAHFR